MSTISASTTSTTAYKVTADTTGTLVFQTGASPTTALSISSAQVVSFTNPPTATGAGSVATNTAYGTSALAANTTGSQNTAIGYQAGATETAATNLTAVGHQAANSATGSGIVAVGTSAAFGATGDDNTAIGVSALLTTSSGTTNTAVGRSALRLNTTGSSSAALGYQAGYTNTGGNLNIFVGYQAGYYFTGSANTIVGSRTVGSSGTPCTGNYNAIFGDSAGVALQGTSASNTFIGGSAGYYITTGTKNTILGAYNGNQGGLNITTASNYIVLSDGDGNPRLYYDSSSATWKSPEIYNATTASGANIAIAGNYGLYRSTSALKYKQDVRDVEDFDINALRPVRYKSKCENDDQTKDHLGLIADEAAEAGFEELVTRGADGEVEGFQYERLTVVLLKSLQTLKADLDATKAELAALKGA